MIGEFENTPVNTGYPVPHLEMLSLIKTIVLTRQDFVFASEALFESNAQWIQDIQDENIYILRDITEVDNQSEETEYIKSVLDYEWKGKPGKYMYLFRTLYEKEYHDYISAFSGQDVRVFFGDVNQNVIANLSGSQVRGLDVSTIDIQKKKFGTSDAPWTVIKIVLSSAVEFNLSALMEWNLNRINLIHVDITDITGSGNELNFTIKDQIYGVEIDNLYYGDIILVDNNSGVSVVLLTEIGCGQYRITTSDPLTYGTIQIKSSRFYSGIPTAYVINIANVELSNYLWYSRTKFEVDIAYFGGGAYTGLVLVDFTINDDIAGSTAITAVSEISTGRYEIQTTGTDLTSGTISVNDGIVSGSDTYTVQVVCTITEQTYTMGQRIQGLKISVTETESTDAVTGLGLANFTISDDYNTTTINSVVETSPGIYFITITPTATSGTVNLIATLFTGSGTYNLPDAIILNTGTISTTDFINQDVNGVPEYIAITSAAAHTITVVSIPGFTGNALRIINSGSPLPVNMNLIPQYFKAGVNYRLKFYYVLYNVGTGSNKYVHININGSLGSYLSEEFTEIPLSHNLYLSAPFQIPQTEYYIVVQFAYNNIINTMTLEIDEIELIEV